MLSIEKGENSSWNLTLNSLSEEGKIESRIDDVMKSPSINDKRAPRLCNPLTLRLSRIMRFMWPAINKRSHLGFSNLFDDYPDRIDTTKSVSFLRAKLA